MRNVLTIVAILIICCGMPGWAWQVQQQLQPMYVPSQAPAAPVPYNTNPGPRPNYSSPPVPAPQYQQVDPQAQGGVRQGQYPQYPYPKYHNPYFYGMSPRAVLSNTLEWFFTLPVNVMGKFSEFIDATAFPQKPATHGGAHQPNAQGQYQEHAPQSQMHNQGNNQYVHPGGQVPQTIGR